MKIAASLTLLLAFALFGWSCSDLKGSMRQRLDSSYMSPAEVDDHLRNERNDELLTFLAGAGIVAAIVMFAKS